MKRLTYIVLLFTLGSCSGVEKEAQGLQQGKIKGYVFTGPGKGPYQETSFSSIAGTNGNFVALVPEATVYRQTLKVEYNFDRQWYGETKRGLFDGIDKARKSGLKVMLKPHLTIGWDMSKWNKPEYDRNDSLSVANYINSASVFLKNQENKILGKGDWRGGLMTTSEGDWELFAEEYTAFVVDYAKIADSLNVELFCIGTELKLIALEKPQFMRKLAGEIRKVYKGPITYAANWDAYDKIEFWDVLDLIGVDAYFPLSDKRLPEIDELEESWRSIAIDLSSVSKKFKKPVIFTEWGYEDEEYVAKEPWVMTKTSKPRNETMQANAYRSMFQTVWNEPWMKGVFLWRWEPESYTLDSDRPNYSPRLKKAEKVLHDWFIKK